MAEPSLESIFSPEIIENPYPMYQALREGSPVLELPDANMLVLTRYEDIQKTLRDRTLGHADDSMMTEEQLAEIHANVAADHPAQKPTGPHPSARPGGEGV